MSETKENLLKVVRDQVEQKELEYSNIGEIVEKQKEPIVFNPQSDYSWKNDDEFTINGKEFEIVHNTLSAIFNTNLPQSQMYIMLNEMFKITTSVLKREVEYGTIKEVVKEKSLSQTEQ